MVGDSSPWSRWGGSSSPGFGYELKQPLAGCDQCLEVSAWSAILKLGRSGRDKQGDGGFSLWTEMPMAYGLCGPGPVQLWGGAWASRVAEDKLPAGLRESFVTRLLAVNSFAREVTK